MLAITDPKDRELVQFSVGETCDASVKVLDAAVPRPQSTGPSDKYIMRRVSGCAPFMRTQTRFPLPPTQNPQAVIVGDEEVNTFTGE